MHPTSTKIFQRRYRLILWMTTFFLLQACTEKKLAPEDVEYRKQEDGTLLLYKIGADEPFGNKKISFVQEKHPNGEISFKIGFFKMTLSGKMIYISNFKS